MLCPHICGSLLTLDVVVHLRRLQIVDNGKERSVIAAYHITDGDRLLLRWFPQKRADKVQQTLRRRACTGKQCAIKLLCCCHHLMLTWRNNHPTKWKERVSLAIAEADKSTGVDKWWQYLTIHPKVHSHVILTQMNIKQGLLAFGESGNEAVLKELRQLHDKKALMPIQKAEMTYDEWKKALRYLMLLKEKAMAW